ncbi:MAG: helix-turn-helix domain-containing protein [Dehalococcoidia bacterium]|nr:helix-turn-helix domain-containing protein [Dehalococcoidia bacterium]
MAESERRLDYKDPEWLADQLGVDKSTIYRYLREGTIPAVQLGRKWLVSEAQVVEFLDTQARMQTEVRRKGMAPLRNLDKFTERTRRALAAAQEEAKALNHNYIGTEHLLLGMLGISDCVAAFSLRNLGMELEATREAVVGIVGRGHAPVSGDLGLTPRAKSVIDSAVDAARRMSLNYVGTEHILLGLLEESEGVAAGILAGIDPSQQAVRGELARLLILPGGPAAWAAVSQSPLPAEAVESHLHTFLQRRGETQNPPPIADEPKPDEPPDSAAS